MEEKLQWAFELYDLNKDGTITKAEMTELITVSDLISFLFDLNLWLHGLEKHGCRAMILP